MQGVLVKKPQLYVYIHSVYMQANETLFQKGYCVFKELFDLKIQDNANYIVIKGQSWWLAVLRTG